MADRRRARRRVLCRRGGARAGPHRVRGRRRQAVDLQLSARRPARVSAHARAFPAPRRRRPAGVVRGAAGNLVPRRRTAAARGRRGVRRRGGGGRGRARRRADPPPRRALGPCRAGRIVAAGAAASRRRQPATARGAHPPRPRHRRDDRPLAGAGRAARTARAGDPRRRRDGSGAAARRVRHRPAARAEAPQRAGRRRRPAGPDRAARGAGSDRARPVPAVSGRRPDPGDGAERAAVRHFRGRAVPARPRLRRLAPGHPSLAAAAERLGALLARADFVPPYELYAEILGAEGGRRAMLERLGPEADDPIEEFLAQALLYEREHVPSLQGFLHWLESGEIEVSRDFAARQRDEVRILTVHGAKGLEAPIVFLPDTMQVPEPRANLLWSEREAMPLWAPRIAMAPPAYRAEREAQRRRDLQEYRRLLYVALTRAQDRLYVCGWLPRITPNAGNWYTLCQAGWRGMMTPFAFDTTGLIGEAAGWRGEGLRLASAQAAPPADPARSRVAAAALPGWLDRPPPPEPDPPKPLLPSRPGGSEPATLSPLATAGRDRFKRGLLVHRLMQALPELPPDERAAAARRFLALPAHGLDPAEQEEICGETLAVLAEPGFAELWGPQ